MTYTAKIDNRPIVTFWAANDEEADRTTAILLRGRPGVTDLHKAWIEGGKSYSKKDSIRGTECFTLQK